MKKLIITPQNEQLVDLTQAEVNQNFNALRGKFGI